MLAPLVLALLPVVLWLSVPLAGASEETPVWLTVPDPVFTVDPVFLVSLGLVGSLSAVMLTVEASLASFSLHAPSALGFRPEAHFCLPPLRSGVLGGGVDSSCPHPLRNQER